MPMHNKKTIAILAAVIALTSLLAYSPTFSNDFVWDDLHFTTNPALIDNNPYSFIFDGGVYYRPLLHLSVVLDYSFWHLNPFGFHLTNTLLHTVCSLLVFLVSLYLFSISPITPSIGNTQITTIQHPVALSLIAALLFALHPVHTESVAWINGRTDILATLFFLLAFLSYLIYVKEERNTALILSSFFFLFSLSSKENAVALIAVIFVYGIMTGVPKKRIFLSELALFAGFIGYLILRSGGGIREFAATPGSREAFFSSGITLGNFFEIFLLGTGYYYEKLALPFDLNILPQLPENTIYFLISLVPLLIAYSLYVKGKRLQVFMVTWVIVTLLPSLTILYSQIAAPVAERYLYLPSVGFAIFLSMLIGRMKSRKIVLTSVLTILMIYGVTTFDRLGDWKNDLALWEDTVLSKPDSANARTNYAAALIRTGKSDRAREELLIAVKKKNISLGLASKILELRGHIETESGNYEKAEEHLVNSIKANDKNKSAYNNLGFLYASMADATDDTGKKAFHMKAIEKYEMAVKLSPSFIQPKYNIGLSYMKMGEFEKSLEYLHSVIKSDPEGGMSQKAVKFIVLIERLKGRGIKGI
jgi:tetratricopeptide (TPR) repeat protein